MAEKLDLTVPVVVTTTTDEYKVVFLMMNSEAFGVPPVTIPPALPTPVGPGIVMITVKDNNGGQITHQFQDVLAQDMIKFINTGDFTVRSLHKRILEKLSAMGILVGTVSGVPDVPTAPTGLE